MAFICPVDSDRTFEPSVLSAIALSRHCRITPLWLGRRAVFRLVEVAKEEETEVGVQEKIRRLLPVSARGRFPSRT